jgi:hypothetical protein
VSVATWCSKRARSGADSGQAALAAFLQRCHDWGENDDPDGRQFPRAKRHDDKAIATVRPA